MQNVSDIYRPSHLYYRCDMLLAACRRRRVFFLLQAVSHSFILSLYRRRTEHNPSQPPSMCLQEERFSCGHGGKKLPVTCTRPSYTLWGFFSGASRKPCKTVQETEIRRSELCRACAFDVAVNGPDRSSVHSKQHRYAVEKAAGQSRTARSGALPRIPSFMPLRFDEEQWPGADAYQIHQAAIHPNVTNPVGAERDRWLSSDELEWDPTDMNLDISGQLSGDTVSWIEEQSKNSRKDHGSWQAPVTTPITPPRVQRKPVPTRSPSDAHSPVFTQGGLKPRGSQDHSYPTPGRNHPHRQKGKAKISFVDSYASKPRPVKPRGHPYYHSVTRAEKAPTHREVWSYGIWGHRPGEQQAWRVRRERELEPAQPSTLDQKKVVWRDADPNLRFTHPRPAPSPIATPPRKQPREQHPRRDDGPAQAGPTSPSRLNVNGVKKGKPAPQPQGVIRGDKLSTPKLNMVAAKMNQPAPQQDEPRQVSREVLEAHWALKKGRKAGGSHSWSPPSSASFRQGLKLLGEEFRSKVPCTAEPSEASFACVTARQQTQQGLAEAKAARKSRKSAVKTHASKV